jgi:hypothetical protein
MRRNTTTGELIPEWHSEHPSALTSYAPSGHVSFVITANDITEPQKRPRDLSLPAKPTDPDSKWALVGKYSLGAGGTFSLSDVVCGSNQNGPAGIQTLKVTSATLPSWVGLQLANQFEFYDNCNLHVLNTTFGDAKQSVWFYRLREKY